MLVKDRHIIRLYQLELILLAFALPIYRKIIPYVITILVITWLLEADFAGKAKRIANSRHRMNTLLFSGLYLVYGLGLLYSKNFDYGYFDMEVKMSLFIFPVLMASMPDELFVARMARQVLWAFVMGVLGSILFCYGQAYLRYLEEGTLAVFYYSSLSPLIHPSYLAMYVCLALAIILYFLHNGVIKSRALRITVIALAGLFELFIIMLSSKAGILGLALVLALFSGYLFFGRRQVRQGIITSTLLAASFTFFLLVLPVSAERFEETRDAIQQTDINADEIANSTGERILIWWYSFEITNENFLLGVGTGDVKDHLLDKYREKQMFDALGLELNAHNQYLQTTLTLGILGLIVLLLNLVLPALFGMEMKHYLYLIFLILIAFNFLFESMLETQAGVVFYAFFNAWFFALKKDPAS